MKFHQNEKVRSSAASVLMYKLPEDQLQVFANIKLNVNHFEIFDHAKQMRPGQMCMYIGGKVMSFVSEDQ